MKSSEMKVGDRVVHRLSGVKMLVVGSVVDQVVAAFASGPGASRTDLFYRAELAHDPDPSGIHEALDSALLLAVTAGEFEVAAAIRRVIENFLKEKTSV